MEEGDPGGGGGEQGACCKRMREQIRAEVEMKIKEVEDRMQAKQDALARYVEDLKEIITVREEQVIATMATVKDREETIEGLKNDLKSREEEIKRLRREIQENVGRTSVRESKRQQAGL